MLIRLTKLSAFSLPFSNPVRSCGASQQQRENHVSLRSLRRGEIPNHTMLSTLFPFSKQAHTTKRLSNPGIFLRKLLHGRNNSINFSPLQIIKLILDWFESAPPIPKNKTYKNNLTS
jgi:hypothetical protein